MQLTLFASIAFLCSSALAAPPQRRDNTMIGIDVQNVTVENLPVIVNILKKDASVDLGVLRARGGSSDSPLIGIDIGVSNVLNNTIVKVASP
ncbi:hypothetical protein AZE42_04000 [Rhizopogon vesiculosus]|uniref:Uncharacterized protein n=1 Tax=Rhizopogon vesiculosus TaxID=180088 RepID=A0A1J8QA43_9AGAM|nr:hypothetical protein AZE42_04000 [Rhizopogon vesiculosus]